MNRYSLPVALAAFLLLAGFGRSAARGREWTDTTGRFTIHAELLDVNGPTVRLRGNDGKVVSVPIDRLSEADRRYLASRREPTEPGAGGLTLVKDGRPNAVIVTNGRPKEGQSQAAIELQEHVRVMSGATLPIVKDNELKVSDPRVLILVGKSGLTDKHGVNMSEFEPETFVVKTHQNVLILAGDDGGSKSNARLGTLWAVYDFLQDQLGIRWIWPGDIGRVVPGRKTIQVADLDIRETPQIKVRGFRMLSQEKHKAAYQKEGLGRYLDFGETYDRLSEHERVWLRRMRMGRSFKLSYGHAFTDWWGKHKDTAPDIFALQADGQRRPRKSSKPDFVKMCVSNPKLWDLQLAALRKYARQGATGLWVNACENDGSGGFCTCGRCREWDAHPNAALASMPAVEDGSDVDTAGKQSDDSDLPESLSDRYARWYNELARLARQADPEARVITYAYSRYRSPPSKIERVEPNVWVGYVGFNAYPRPDDYRRMSVDEWFGWSRLGATVFLRSNSLFYCGEGAPYVVSRQIAEDLKFQVENGLRATDYDCLQGYWATTGPSYYVLARLLWDTQADPDEILGEFYAAFGPMAPIAREYFDYWEDFTTRLGNEPEFFGLRRTERLQAYPKFYDEGVLARGQAILDTGKPLLEGASEDERERFTNLQLGLEHGRLMAEALKDGKTSNGVEGKRLMDFRRKIAPRNVVNVYWTTSKEIRYRVFD